LNSKQQQQQTQRTVIINKLLTIMKHVMAFLFALYSLNPTLAQTPGKTGKIDGRLTDEMAKPLEFSTVMLLKAADSTLVKGAISDATGQYAFEHITNGQYRISAQQVGYEKTFSAVFTLDAEHQTVTAPTLMLTETAKKLNEVTVTAKKPFIEQQVDRLVINVENSIVSAGSTVLEVLEKAPGVTIDQQNEQIKLRGKSGVIVEIDGKRSYMTMQEVMNLLRNTPSDNVEKIEVITNPSSKYDAAGTSGIINIKFKKNKNFGTNGTVTLGTGYQLQPGGRGRGNASLALNHREGKINAFGNYSGARFTGAGGNDLFRRIAYNGAVTYFDQKATRLNDGYNHNFKAGIDYTLTKKTTIGLLATGFIEDWRQPNAISKTDILNSDLAVTRRFTTGNSTNNRWDNINLNTNIKHDFDGKGREWTADADYVVYRGKSNNKLGTQYFTPDYQATGRPDSVRNQMPSTIQIGVLKTDYVHPLKKGKFETGLKTSYVVTDNNLTFETKADQWTVDATRSNRFKYTEHISAAYLNYSTTLGKKTQIQTGLRLEHTFSEGNSITLNQVNRRNYTNLFPTLFVTQPLDTNNVLTFSYSRRIDRPNYQNLNPFVFFLDPYTYQQGNPNLRPQFTNSFQLTHVFKSAFNTTLAYNKTTNAIIDEVPRQIASENKTYITSENIDNQDNLSLTLSFPVPVTKWWTMQNNFSAFYTRYKTFYNDQLLDLKQTSWSVYSSQNFKLSKTLSLELSGWYNGKNVYSFWVAQPMGSVNIGLQQSLWEKKGRLSLNVSDLFWTQQFRGSTQFQDIDFSVRSYWPSRQARLTFSYRFGNQNVKGTRERSTGADDLKSRAKTGN
jgi:Outer membrane protein beta-barrel family/Carboxypeptidase regulatory-like domain/TonB-dependent Receptor Plug Domain